MKSEFVRPNIVNASDYEKVFDASKILPLPVTEFQKTDFIVVLGAGIKYSNLIYLHIMGRDGFDCVV